MEEAKGECGVAVEPQQTRWPGGERRQNASLPDLSSSTPSWHRTCYSPLETSSHFPPSTSRHHVARSYHDHVRQCFHPELEPLLTPARSVDNSESSRNGDYT